MTIRFNTRQAVHKLVRSGMPEAQADAAVEVAEDSTRGLVSEERLEATLNRALLRQAAIIITIVITVNAAITTAIMTALLAAFR